MSHTHLTCVETKVAKQPGCSTSKKLCDRFSREGYCVSSTFSCGQCRDATAAKPSHPSAGLGEAMGQGLRVQSSLVGSHLRNGRAHGVIFANLLKSCPSAGSVCIQTMPRHQQLQQVSTSPNCVKAAHQGPPCHILRKTITIKSQ